MFEVLMTEEQKKLRDEVRDLVKSVPRQLILDMDADRISFPTEFLKEAGRRNLLGLRFPRKWGGRELTWTEELIAMEEIGTLGICFGCQYGLVSIVGETLNVYGTDEQKEKYLKPTLAGEMYCAEALTEPRGGSDFFGATTTARKEGDHYILNGQKRFVVGAEGADYFAVYAKTDPDAEPHKSLSLLIVERGEGVVVKHVYGLMGARGNGTGRLLFRDVRVPLENLVGEENEATRIFWQMMIPERLASGITSARAALALATRYANRRKAFGQPIRNFQAVSFKIADCITKLDAVTAFAHTVAKIVQDELGSAGYRRRLVSEVKKFSTQTQWEVLNDCMQILGGIGYTNALPVERELRGARLATIWTGTTEIQNMIIQHEYFKEVLKRGIEGRDIAADVPLTEEELAEEIIYE
ncbi:MAG: acyl-CoA/acyl-ACP dehydrogenase [Deltaproteobacteria bacterium]|nr:acyl-CoA/acyl-ACP dehydrogenase [Deltaproteobacteria bacterium]MBW1925481.1 acyl-CoA/acyl-ACP dehydrogenase [Deltaproteobacteria bacterium]MBW2009892.1 acyl-CoA/acyl-ACP dehydrogenase [Deltaproteobacteria bacterium]